MYKEYIAHELKGKDLARISCVYMRALADHCLDVELWREYLKYLVRGRGGVGRGWEGKGRGGVSGMSHTTCVKFDDEWVIARW